MTEDTYADATPTACFLHHLKAELAVPAKPTAISIAMDEIRKVAGAYAPAYVLEEIEAYLGRLADFPVPPGEHTFADLEFAKDLALRHAAKYAPPDFEEAAVAASGFFGETTVHPLVSGSYPDFIIIDEPYFVPEETKPKKTHKTFNPSLARISFKKAKARAPLAAKGPIARGRR